MISRLPPQLCQPLRALPPWQAASVQEIRLRLGCKVSFTVNGAAVPAYRFCSALTELDTLRISAELLQETLNELCGHSLYAHEEELQHGYFTLPGGHRVGIGGGYSRSQERYVLQTPTSLNIRIARCIAAPLDPQLAALLKPSFGGLALLGPPLSGKTTVLRSIAEHLGRTGKNCTVIDERNELFAARKNNGETPVDVISGIKKQEAVLIALRTLAPHVILLDELGDSAEVAALRQAMFSGVQFVVTLHAGSFEEAEQKQQFRLLRQGEMLRTACLLAGREHPGRIQGVRQY